MLADCQPVFLVFLLLPDFLPQEKASCKAQVKTAAGGVGERLLLPDGGQPLFPSLQDLGTGVCWCVANTEGNLGLQDLEATEVQGAALRGRTRLAMPSAQAGGLQAPGKSHKHLQGAVS